MGLTPKERQRDLLTLKMQAAVLDLKTVDMALESVLPGEDRERLIRLREAIWNLLKWTEEQLVDSEQ